MLIGSVGLLLAAAIPLVSSQCYDQNGESTSDQPCNTGSDPTFCCPSGSSCLSNGLCQQGSSLSMGSCSDKSWKGLTCTAYCAAGSSSMVACLPLSSGLFCCKTGTTTNGQDACCNGDDVYDLGEVEGSSTLAFEEVVKIITPSSTKKTTSKTSTSSVTGKSTSIANSRTSSSSATSTTSTTSTAPPTTTSGTGRASSSSTPTPTGVPPAGLSKSVKVGAAVGGSLGFALISFLSIIAVFFLRRRRQDKINHERLKNIEAKAAMASVSSGRLNQRRFSSAPRIPPTIFDATPMRMADDTRPGGRRHSSAPTTLDTGLAVSSVPNVSPISQISRTKIGRAQTINTPPRRQYENPESFAQRRPQVPRITTFQRPRPESNELGFVIPESASSQTYFSPRESVYQAYSPAHIVTHDELRSPPYQYPPSQARRSFADPTSPTTPITPAEELAAARLRTMTISPLAPGETVQLGHSLSIISERDAEPPTTENRHEL